MDKSACVTLACKLEAAAVARLASASRLHKTALQLMALAATAGDAEIPIESIERVLRSALP
jgi:hypothetical protein